VPDLRFYARCVCAVDEAIDSSIFTEIKTCYGVAWLGLGLADVRQPWLHVGDKEVLFLLLYGRAVPDLDLIVEISELLIKPSTVTSVRKLEELAVVALCALVWLMSEE
jgi:hypothetical protein